MSHGRTALDAHTFDDGPARVACVGLGFVGYNSALAFARAGHHVVGVDLDDELLAAIRRGNAPFETPELATFIDDGDCSVSTRIADAADADVYVISVPTPVDAENVPDLSYVRAAARDVASVLEPGNLVVLQSTVYPGCTRHEVVPELAGSGLEIGVDVGVSHVPERYSPADDLPERTARVVGSISDDWRGVTVDLYEDVADTTAPVSSLEVAETTKLVENVQRDVNIALMNELAEVTERIGIDVQEVIDGAATKWNFHPYEPGLGVGGHCLPVDPHYLREAAEVAGAQSRLVATARAINGSTPDRYAEKLLRSLEAVDKTPATAAVAVLGVTYKPGVKDVRNSPALDLISRLDAESVHLAAFDPQYAVEEPIEGTDLSNRPSAMDAVRNADAAVVATAHAPFRDLDPAALSAAMGTNPILVDPQRTLDADAVDASDLIRPRDLDAHFVPDLRAIESDGGALVSGDARFPEGGR